MARLLNIFISAVCLALLTSCYDYSRDEALDVVSYKETYVSFTVSVMESSVPVTRATWWPQGGEHGTGDEAGFDRENTVTGITLILFKKTTDVDGFNTSANPTLDLIRYYPVTESEVVEKVTQGRPSGLKAYTTGPQPLGKNHKLDLKAEYYAVAIANCYPTELATLKEGESHLNDIRDLTLSTIFMGNAKMAATDISHFVMSLEDNAILNFASATVSDYGGGDKLYDMTGAAIRVERLAARIDFWALNSLNGGWATENKKTEGENTIITGYEGPKYETTDAKDKNGNAYIPAGYVYQVYNSSDGVTDDRFVITHITPFNLNNANEYIFKHDRTNSGTTDVYLGPEDSYPYVIDPLTLSGKTTLSKPSTMLNPLSDITDGSLKTNIYRKSIDDMHTQVSADFGVDGKNGGFVLKDQYTIGDPVTDTKDIGPSEDVIVAYAMENTLPKDANLYYYATGIIIEGDYYTDNDPTKKEHRVYYGFLRHASKTLAPNAYDALLSTDFDTPDKIAALKNVHPVDTDSPMHFGVVRNNIYRIHVNKVYQRGGMSLKIKVKEWDVFHHKEIAM